MSRIRKFIDADVLTEAKRRIHHVYDTFDGVVVAFSGGKDSLATLSLVRECANERGITRVRAVFRDEEVIPHEVVDFLIAYREQNSDWLDLEWWAVPLESHMYVLGTNHRYIQFDPSREWVRQPPPFALTLADLGQPDGTVLTQYDVDDLTIRNIKGKVALFTGVRAAESMLRYRSCVNKLHENYIVASSTPRAKMVRPIFDWQENDVFRYFYDRGITYCPVYDGQAWSGGKLRVCSALASEPARNRWELHRSFAPDLYEGIMRVFPDMAVQERYYREFDQQSILADNADTWEAIEAWVDENVTDPRHHGKAIKELTAVRIRAERVPESYPLPYVLKQLMSHGGKRTIQPMRPDDGRTLQARHDRRANA